MIHPASLLETPLHDRHVALGAQMVDFGGWHMPLHYGSLLEEHHAVRRDAGVFDVSHMRAIDVTGGDALTYLRRLLANDVARLQPGRALYTCLLNESGGIQDDLIAYHLAPASYRLIVNAANATRDHAWLLGQRPPASVTISSRTDLAILSVQGPAARERVAQCMAALDAKRALELRPFHATDVRLGGHDALCARTGYTGEDGFEIVLPASRAPALWDALLAAGVRPCGLGARDTLRLEAGLNLHGAEMDEQTTPLECGLAWTVAWDEDRDFIGRRALITQRAAGVLHRLAGLVLEERGVPRAHQRVYGEHGEGLTTSGTYSPTLERGIALARVPVSASGRVWVDVRGRSVAARLVRPAFVRHGRALIDLPALTAALSA